MRGKPLGTRLLRGPRKSFTPEFCRFPGISCFFGVLIPRIRPRCFPGFFPGQGIELDNQDDTPEFQTASRLKQFPSVLAAGPARTLFYFCGGRFTTPGQRITGDQRKKFMKLTEEKHSVRRAAAKSAFRSQKSGQRDAGCPRAQPQPGRPESVSFHGV